MKRSARKSAQQWAALVAEWQSNGDSEVAFCEQRGLVLSTFQKWRRQQRYEAQVAARVAEGHGAFVQVVPRRADRGDCVTIHLGEQLRVDCPLSLGVERLAQLVLAVRHGR